VFAVVTTVLALGLLNVCVEMLERAGVLETHRLDDYVQFLDEPLFARDGDWITTSEYAEEFMVPGRLRRDKGDRYRVIILGASFAMGTPYTVNSHGEERPGGIATWLRADLARRFGPDGYEVLNAAAGAQTSHRVRRIAEEVLQLEPDLLVVASCNNEGPPKPGYVREQLHKLGAYRLLTSLAAPSGDPEARPTFTPQLLDAEQVRTEFSENIGRILDVARKAGVPVALATLPLNLRYGGDGAPLPPEDLAGRHVEDACVRDGREAYARGEFEGALELLTACGEDIPDAARWTGLSLAALGRTDEARTALAMSIELLPRNRCRPSLNAETRKLANNDDNAYLADLEATAETVSVQGLPGPELFVDYCHLNWRGYALMAETLIGTLESADLIPAASDPIVDTDALARDLGLEEVPALRERGGQ